MYEVQHTSSTILMGGDNTVGGDISLGEDVAVGGVITVGGDAIRGGEITGGGSITSSVSSHTDSASIIGVAMGTNTSSPSSKHKPSDTSTRIATGISAEDTSPLATPP